MPETKKQHNLIPGTGIHLHNKSLMVILAILLLLGKTRVRACLSLANPCGAVGFGKDEAQHNVRIRRSARTH